MSVSTLRADHRLWSLALSNIVRAVDKQTFPNLDVVGWYATGGGLTREDMVLHRKVGTIDLLDSELKASAED